MSLTGATYAHAAPTRESFPPIFENIRLSGAVTSLCFSFTIRLRSTQCTPIVGIQPKTGWYPALVAALEVPSELVALATPAISFCAFADTVVE